MVTSVDKYEFKLKVDEMKALVSARNYNAAAEIAETINWRKIRNLNALVLAGEVFEQVVVMRIVKKSFFWHMINRQLAEISYIVWRRSRLRQEDLTRRRNIMMNL